MSANPATTVEYEYFRPLHGKPRKLLPRRKFDRKTFDPINNTTDRAILKVLRGPGIARYGYLKYGNIYPSPSLRHLLPDMRQGMNKGEWYVDFGCGESADRFIAERVGMKSIGMDLFPPLFTKQPTQAPGFILGDIAEPLPFDDHTFTYATCHACIALLQLDERLSFYREVYRVMKIGGMFVLNGLHLKNGYGFDLKVKRSRLLNNTEFEYVSGIGYGMVVERQ